MALILCHLLELIVRLIAEDTTYLSHTHEEIKLLLNLEVLSLLTNFHSEACLYAFSQGRGSNQYCCLAVNLVNNNNNYPA